MRWEVDHVVVRGPQERLDAFGLAADDVKEAGRVAAMTTEVADELAVDVVLSEAEQTG
jgi:hypothetical protein